MSKFTKKRIEEIQALTTQHIPEAINRGITNEAYDELRITLNLTVIQAVFGLEFNFNKKDNKPAKIKYNHKVADSEEVAVIARLMDTFVNFIEKPYFGSDVVISADNDMEIPVKEQMVSVMPALDKVRNKNIHDYIFGNDGGAAISRMLLNGMDVVEMAATAKKVKKIKTRNTMLIIGGITLLVTGGIVAGICINNAKKNDDVDDGPEVDMSEIDNIEIEDVDMSDAPVVEFSEI